MQSLKVLSALPSSADLAVLGQSIKDSGLAATVTEYQDSSQALNALLEDDFDCAFVSAGNPEFDRVDILSELRRAGSSVPIVFVLGDDGESKIANYLLAGAHDCLTLSEITPDTVARTLNTSARVRRAEVRAAEAEARRSRQLLYDTLTGLPNRALFFDRLDQSLALARRQRQPLSVMVMDLNRFREVNATLGHPVGDQLLQAVAGKITSSARKSDTIARLGGDEFALLLTTGGTYAGTISAAEKILESIQAPIIIQNQQLAVSTSIGISFYPEHGEDSATLMRHADIAMYAAKRNATGFSVYAGEAANRVDADHVFQLSLSGDLRRAIQEDQLELMFQPKIGFDPIKICGVEALVRWNHPQHGMVTPDNFIPLAEQTGVIEPLTIWVLNAALREYSRWRDEGIEIPVAVNLSPVTLHDRNFSRDVEKILEIWDVPSEALSFEITESAIMSDVARATETVNRLHAIGVGISIDDFGTGYTSLSYISKLPVREIKVDKSFVMGMRETADDAVIVRSIVELGHNLSLSVVAEGIEDTETWDLLGALKCDVAQGFLMSRPLPSDAVFAWVYGSEWSGHAEKEDTVEAVQAVTP